MPAESLKVSLVGNNKRKNAAKAARKQLKAGKYVAHSTAFKVHTGFTMNPPGALTKPR
jgi:hypothetical protein